MCVVHTSSPEAIVASRWTWLPSSLDSSLVSARQMAGEAQTDGGVGPGDVSDRAVMLAELLSGRQRLERRRVPGVVERLDDALGAVAVAFQFVEPCLDGGK